MNPPASELQVLFVCTHNAGRSIVAAARVPTAGGDVASLPEELGAFRLESSRIRLDFGT